MRIYPAVHYTMGGLWVDYNLMSSIPGLYVMGEANFSDHGANRLGASALMQGLADGYFVIPYTIADYLSGNTGGFSDTSASEFIETEKGIQDNIQRMLSIKGSQTVDEIHKKLGLVMWENVGMARNKEGLKKAIIEIPKLRKEFWEDVNIPGSSNSMNTELEKAGRLADFLELGELMARDALEREESCGGHFREEFQTEENEAKRDDKNFTFVSAWEFKGVEKEPVVHKEDLVFENVKLTTRSYK